MLHGFSFREGLLPLARLLSPHFRVLIPDLPFSTNDEYHAAHKLDAYVEFLIDFCRSLDLTRVSIFGNSVGGTLALMCCIRSSYLFDKLVVRCPLWSKVQLPVYLKCHPLISTHQFLSSSIFYANNFLKLFYWLSARMSPVEDEPKSLPGVESPPGSTPETIHEINPSIFSKFLGTLVKVEIKDQLKLIPNETLILWGQNDNLISSSWGEYQGNLQPNSHFHAIEGEYHNISTSDHASLSKIMIDFLGGM